MRKLTIAVVVLLVGAIAYQLWTQREDLAVYWREWSSVQRHFQWQDKQFGLRKPFLSKSISRLDPEAADIVEWMMHEDRENFKDVEYLSKMALRYPENQYFLHTLASTIAQKGYTDPQIVDLLADRLLELDPNNGRYYLLKAWASFYDWHPDRVEKTLDYLERCFQGCQQDPSYFYKARAATLVEKEKPSVYLSWRAGAWFPNDLDLRRRLIQGLLEHTQDLIINGRAEEAMRIHDRLQKIAETSIPQTIQEPWQLWISFQQRGLSSYSGSPQTVELKWMQLSPERAKQDRMQMLAWKTLTEQISAVRQESKPKPRTDYRSYVLHLVPPGAHCFEMTIVSAAALVGFIALGLLLKMQRSRVPFYSWICATVFFAAYFALCRFCDYSQMHQSICGSHHYTYDYTLLSQNAWIAVVVLKKFAWASAVVMLVTAIIGTVAVRFYLKRPTRLRFSMTYAAAIVFIFLLWLRFSNLSWAISEFHIFVLWLVVPLICLRPAEKGEPVAGLFSRTDDGRQLRMRCVAVCGYLLVLHVVCFGFLGRSLLIKASAEVEKEAISLTWPVFTPPRFETNEKQYADLLHRLENEKQWDNLQNLLPMVEPKDIPAVLTAIKQRRQNDPNYRTFWDEMPSMGPDSSSKPTKYMSDLHRALELCGKDALPAIIPFLEDPDSPIMFIIRGRAGDTSVHDGLVTLWKQYRDAGFPSDDMTTPMIDESESTVQRIPLECLVGVCPYSEFKEYVLEIARHKGVENGYFILDRGIIEHFSREQKGELLSELLTIDSDKVLTPIILMELMHRNFPMQPNVKERLWKQVIYYGNLEHEWKRLDFDVTGKPYDYHISDDLLEECMSSKDRTVRSMGQHIWRVMDKPLDDAVIERWRKDTHFVIRANAALLNPEQQATDDPSHFVRLIRSLCGS